MATTTSIEHDTLRINITLSLISVAQSPSNSFVQGRLCMLTHHTPSRTVGKLYPTCANVQASTGLVGQKIICYYFLGRPFRIIPFIQLHTFANQFEEFRSSPNWQRFVAE
jgi:hypothetical protein